MMLTTKGRYAVMAMVDLASQSHEKPISLADIAARQSIPLNYLEQIFAKLRGSGLVSSVRGPGGGYRLQETSESTCIADIVVAVEEPIKITRCNNTGESGCMDDKTRCLTHDLWEGLGNHIFAYLRHTSLADVCNRSVALTPEYEKLGAS